MRLMRGLSARVRKNAEVQVKNIMQKSIGHIEADSLLIDALKLLFRKKIIMLPVYDKERLVGVLRDVDVFLAVADIIRE